MITLTVTNTTTGKSDSSSKTVWVLPPPPQIPAANVAVAILGPSADFPGNIDVKFTVTIPSPPQFGWTSGDVENYKLLFDFGDGGKAVESVSINQVELIHRYERADTFNATVRLNSRCNNLGPVSAAIAVDTRVLKVSGRIVDGGGVAVAGVTVTFAAGPNPPAPVVTDVNGTYQAQGFSTGTYTVTPTKIGATFQPTNRSIKLKAEDKTNVNFTKQ